MSRVNSNMIINNCPNQMMMFFFNVMFFTYIVNNDHQAKLKKGRSFMPVDERITLLKEFKCIDIVVKSIDMDRTVCETLRTVEPKPYFFCNGGDQNNNTIPETQICVERGIELRDGFGEKIQSSSWLIKSSK